MNENNQSPCKHKYTVGYSFRMPPSFFRSLPCDNCGCKIQLSLPWRILYWFVDIVGFIAAFTVSMSVQIKLFGNTFLVSIAIFVVLIWIVQLLNRLVLRYGNWVEVHKK